MEIREALETDAQEIHNLYREVMQYDYPVEKMREMIAYVKQDACNFVFVASDQKEVVGVAEVVIKYSIHKESYLIINCLAVQTSRQGEGIGSRLLAHAEAFAKSRGLGSMTVGSRIERKKAHRFYEGNGFQSVKEHKIFVKKLI